MRSPLPVAPVSEILATAVLALLAVLAGCAGGGAEPPAAAPPPPPAPGPEASAPEAAAPPAPAAASSCPQSPGLCLTVEPGDAELSVDGARHGPVSALGPAGATFLALTPGIHQIVLTRDGYVTWRTEVSVAAGPERFVVELERRP